MCDFDNPPEPEEFDAWEPSPEEIASIERAIQDMNDGFGYEMLQDDNPAWTFKCLKCGRTAELRERPFPHKFDCPMKWKIKD